MGDLILQLSTIFIQTCEKPPPPQLTQRTQQQGGFLPRNLQKQWKKQLKLHHETPKAIYIAQHKINWRIHPQITNLPQNITQPQC
jgi:hypothetical protein